MDSVEREKLVVKTSVIGILANVLLAGSKAAIGLMVHSIAIVLDAVNNLTDALSSIVTIIGVKLGNKKPDKEHPMGHGRLEYISAMAVSAIIIYAGATSFIESVKAIIEPHKPDHGFASLLIIGIAIAVKVVLGLYVRRKGIEFDSGALVASGKDALFDALISGSVLVSALIYLNTGVSLEAYVGILISLVIIKAGIDMIKETTDDIVGKRPSAELSRKIKEIITAEPEVLGAYDLFITNYGPRRDLASVHIELRSDMTVDEVDVLTRRLQEKVIEGTGIVLTGVSVYSSSNKDSDEYKLRNDITNIVMAHDYALQVHGFHVDADKKEIRFDVVLDFSEEASDARSELLEELKKEYPDYDFRIVCDVDVSD